MSNVKFSVLIPVYNTGKYLEKCVESVLNQTYDNFEIIIMDDGSDDKLTIQICDNYSGYSKVKVIHKENEGLLLTRKQLLNMATGEYVCNLDSDDWWNLRLLEYVNKVIERTQADLILYRWRRSGTRFNRPSPKIFRNGKIITDKNRKIIIDKLFGGVLLNNLVLKIGKRELYEDICYKYSSIQSGEDRLQSIPLLLGAKKIYYLNKKLYYYYNNPNSITHTNNANTIINKYNQSKLFDEFTIQQMNYYIKDMCWEKKFYAYKFKTKIEMAVQYLETEVSLEEKIEFLQMIFSDESAKKIKQKVSERDLDFKLKKYYKRFKANCLVNYLIKS